MVGFPGQLNDRSTSSRPSIKLQSNFLPKLSTALGVDLAAEAGKQTGQPSHGFVLHWSSPLSNYFPSEGGHPLQQQAGLDPDTGLKWWKEFRVA